MTLFITHASIQLQVLLSKEYAGQKQTYENNIIISC